ncbi:MAG: hypothetical protein DWQ51_21855 [Microcystis wesenbergii TW10]|uniref:Uncharacterized protein n=2 Tax=Microcystis TaxID=1125 RepID=A0A552ABI5_MICAE|nr:MAG: hypothetical protein DWQ51_21855 [Microcystis wesenbergii TW10]TRT82794.1 MAG: hypothetical protein EWV63_18845 [Microcystis aeruginosa Ma_OC_H_19870700_S124]
MIHESTLPYQGGIKGGLKAKSMFNLIITSYLGSLAKLISWLRQEITFIYYLLPCSPLHNS